MLKTTFFLTIASTVCVSIAAAVTFSVQPPPVRIILKGHKGLVLALAFSPDGMTLASASDDETVRLWNAATGEPLAVSPFKQPPGKPAVTLAFSPDSKSITVVDWGNNITTWDLATGKAIKSLAIKTNAAQPDVFPISNYSFTFGPSDKHLLLMTREPGVYLVNSATGVKTTKIAGKVETWPLGYPAMAIASDCRMIALADRHDVTLFETTSGKKRLTIPSAASAAMAFTPDGKALASAGSAGKIAFWDARAGHLVGFLIGDGRPVYGLQFSPDGRTLYCRNAENAVRWWHLASGRSMLLHGGGPVPSDCWALSADGLRLAFPNSDGHRTIKTIPSIDGSSTYIMPTAEQEIVLLKTFSPSLQSVVTKLIATWGDPTTGDREKTIKRLKEIGVPAFSAVEAAMESPSASIRKEAEAFLKAINIKPPVPVLVESEPVKVDGWEFVVSVDKVWIQPAIQGAESPISIVLSIKNTMEKPRLLNLNKTIAVGIRDSKGKSAPAILGQGTVTIYAPPADVQSPLLAKNQCYVENLTGRLTERDGRLRFDCQNYLTNLSGDGVSRLWISYNNSAAASLKGEPYWVGKASLLSEPITLMKQAE